MGAKKSVDDAFSHEKEKERKKERKKERYRGVTDFFTSSHPFSSSSSSFVFVFVFVFCV